MAMFDSGQPYDSGTIFDAQPGDPFLVGPPGVLTLALPSGVTLDLAEWSHGVIVSTVDLGAPSVRENTADLPEQDGDDDQTTYLGPRVVTLEGTLVPSDYGDSASKGFDLLAPFLAPAARPRMTFALDEDMDVRTLTLRASQWTAARLAHSIPFQLQFKGDPVALSATATTVNVAAEAPALEGAPMPFTFPLTFPPGGSVGLGTATTLGTYPTWPTYRLFGPVTNPAIAILDSVTAVPRGQITFTGLTVPAADYLEINSRARTVMLNGDASRYSFLDVPHTTWAPLQPGPNQIRYFGSTAQPPAMAEIIWQDAYL